jgi:hypothetical protein
LLGAVFDNLAIGRQQASLPMRILPVTIAGDEVEI